LRGDYRRRVVVATNGNGRTEEIKGGRRRGGGLRRRREHRVTRASEVVSGAGEPRESPAFTCKGAWHNGNEPVTKEVEM